MAKSLFAKKGLDKVYGTEERNSVKLDRAMTKSCLLIWSEDFSLALYDSNDDLSF